MSGQNGYYEIQHKLEDLDERVGEVTKRVQEWDEHASQRARINGRRIDNLTTEFRRSTRSNRRIQFGLAVIGIASGLLSAYNHSKSLKDDEY